MNTLNAQSGFLLVNKPAGWSSFDVVKKMRGITGIRKIGHAGTLDPFATGLLIVAIGREATKQIDNFIKKDKTYVATMHLGATSETFDTEGLITKSNWNIKIPEEKIKKELRKFIGAQKQIPPMFSAKKINGQKLYKLARQGKTVKREPTLIEIFDIEILEYSWPELKIKIHCSSGTYVRSLGNDIGIALKCGAYLTALERTLIRKFKLDDAKNIEEINGKNWNNFLFQ